MLAPALTQKAVFHVHLQTCMPVFFLGFGVCCIF
jgi:hypothetical protein